MIPVESLRQLQADSSEQLRELALKVGRVDPAPGRVIAAIAGAYERLSTEEHLELLAGSPRVEQQLVEDVVAEVNPHA